MIVFKEVYFAKPLFYVLFLCRELRKLVTQLLSRPQRAVVERASEK